MFRIYDWKAIQQYHDQGYGFVECRKRFGLTHTAWNKAIKRGELRTAVRPFSDRRQRYDWAEIKAYYDDGNSYGKCMARFDFGASAWFKACQRGEITTRKPGMPLDELLAHRGSRRNVKLRLLRAGLIRNQCDSCGLSEWRGKPLSVHIEHINGIHNDHRLENLRMLCPNCHSQTETYGGRNIGHRRLQGEPGVL